MQVGRIKKILLLGVDLFLLYLSLYLALLLRYQRLPETAVWESHLLPFSLLFAVWLLIFYVNGLYEVAASKNDIEFYNKLLRNLIINFAFAAAYFYFLTDRLFDIKPRAIFFIFLFIITLLLPLWRWWYNTLLGRPKFLKNVIVVGMNDEAKELIKEIIQKPQLGYRISGIIHDGYGQRNEFPTVAVYNSSVNLKKLLIEHNARTVVTVIDPHTNPKLVQQLYESLALKLEFHNLPTFYEKLTGKIPVTTIGQLWFLENIVESEKTIYEILKRLFDLVLATLILIMFLPFVPLVVLLIKLDTPGPVLFRQIRVGSLGKTFMAIKFRSMIVGAEQNGQPQWAQKNDLRITGIGKFMRKTRIDEIPQLLNVIRGEMSLVGPRPERPEFVKNLQQIIPFYNERHLVKPGLTGWAQINFQYGASAGDALKKLQYDLFYIKNRSWPLDLGIILKTINIILSGKGQ